MDAHVRKWHTSTIGVGGSKVHVFVLPGRCDVRSRCRSVSVFQSWACFDVVVVVVGHFARDYDGGGCFRWSVVRASCPLRACFFFFLSALS